MKVASDLLAEDSVEQSVICILPPVSIKVPPEIWLQKVVTGKRGRNLLCIFICVYLLTVEMLLRTFPLLHDP